MSNVPERFAGALNGLGVNAQSKVLLALSGGLDSTVLFHLLRGAGIAFAAAHVNYGLRGMDSVADETFCAQLCEANHITLYVHDAGYEMQARPGGVSVQELAREIRYRFFDSLCRAEGFTHIATAHHANDSAETFFVNLLRGTGLNGLRGIPAVNGITVRPLWGFTRAELEAYAETYGLRHREDASNRKDDYLRNRIRHHVVPALQTAEENALERMAESMRRLSADADLLDALMQLHFPEPLSHTPKSHIRRFPERLWATVIFKRFQRLGLNADQAGQMALALEGIAGKLFYTPTHRLLVDREAILAEEISERETSGIRLENGNAHVPGYQICILPFEDVTIAKDNACAFLDADALTFPLMWRPIRTGDAMRPLGMKGRKKISDLLTDTKTDTFTKQRLNVLCNADGEIVWLEGVRIADSSKITAQTCRVLCIIPEKL